MARWDARRRGRRSWVSEMWSEAKGWLTTRRAMQLGTLPLIFLAFTLGVPCLINSHEFDGAVFKTTRWWVNDQMAIWGVGWCLTAITLIVGVVWVNVFWWRIGLIWMTVLSSVWGNSIAWTKFFGDVKVTWGALGLWSTVAGSTFLLATGLGRGAYDR